MGKYRLTYNTEIKNLFCQLITHANQIISQLLHNLGSFISHNTLGVVSNQNGLFCLDKDNSSSVLKN